MKYSPSISRALLRRYKTPLCVIILLCFVASALAQWTTQSIPLRPGWNAIFLEVEPEPRDCDSVFAGMPVESVWRWNRRFTSVQFIQDPNQLIREPDAWLVWIPLTHQLTGRSTLFILEGGFPFLIKNTNASVFNWNVRGRPVHRKIEWVPDALNLVGFSLPVSSPTNFQAFLAGASGLGGQPVYRMNAAGAWNQVLNPATTPMQRGEAFWIRAAGLPTFQGPLELHFIRRSGLDFARALTEQTFRIQNSTTNTRTVLISQVASEVPPHAGQPPLAGSVPLAYWQNDFANNRVGWTNLPPQLQAIIPAGGTWDLRFEVRRREMSATVDASALYQSLLLVSDTSGLSRRMVAVSAAGPVDPAPPEAVSRQSTPTSTPVARHAGLWIGNASVTNVSQPASFQPFLSRPTASEFSFRLLVHVGANGQPRLLQKVLQMWKPGTYKPADDGSTNLVVDQSGRFVLLTNDRLIPRFAGVALRDGVQVGRRFSSAAFGFRDPLPMIGDGEFGTPGSFWLCQVTLPYRDPLNPFVHIFHPDHDNLNERFETSAPLAEGLESFKVDRIVQLEFTANDPENLALAGWGDTQLGGIYYESITGLHRSPIYVSGTFRLHHASRVNVLDDGI